MINIVKKEFGRYRIGLNQAYAHSEPEQIVALLNQPPEISAGVLAGRNGIIISPLASVGTVAIKGYRRGGIFGHFVQRRYVRSVKSRPEHEFEMLDRVRDLGVNAPEPVAYVELGRWLYRGWLITREIPGRQPLASFDFRDEEEARSLMEEIGRQISILIINRIFHVDLHPGNVVIGADGDPYILDFDKAVEFKGSIAALRDNYVHRWRRAVIKHDLPQLLSEFICLQLRRSFEGLRDTA